MSHLLMIFHDGLHCFITWHILFYYIYASHGLAILIHSPASPSSFPRRHPLLPLHPSSRRSCPPSRSTCWTFIPGHILLYPDLAAVPRHPCMPSAYLGWESLILQSRLHHYHSHGTIFPDRLPTPPPFGFFFSTTTTTMTTPRRYPHDDPITITVCCLTRVCAQDWRILGSSTYL